MALIHADFVEETTTTTGTGTLSLAGATTGHRTFVSAIGDANTCIYAIAASDGNFESGMGTVADASPDTLARTTLLSSTTGSKLDLPAGTHRVYCTFAADGGAKAYDAVMTAASQAEMEAGTESAIRSMSPLRVAQAIAALAGTGGVDTANSPAANEFARFTDAGTIEGRTAAEARADLDLEPGIDVFRFLTHSPQTATTADITGAVNTHYLCTIAGLTDHRNLTLPTATAGDRIRVTVLDGDASYALIIKGAATVTINGGSAATEWSRLFIAAETVEFEATSGANWQVVQDGRKPSSAKMSRPTADTIGNLVWEKCLLDTLVSDTGGMVDTVNGRITVRRAGIYTISPFGSLGAMPDQTRVGVSVYKNGSSYLSFPKTSVSHPSTGTFAAGGSSIEPSASAGSYYELWMFQDTGSDKSTGTTVNSPTLTVTEALP